MNGLQTYPGTEPAPLDTPEGYAQIRRAFEFFGQLTPASKANTYNRVSTYLLAGWASMNGGNPRRPEDYVSPGAAIMVAKLCGFELHYGARDTNAYIAVTRRSLKRAEARARGEG